MSKMSEQHQMIQDDIELGELTFRQIAIKHGVSYYEVDMIAQEMADQVEYDDDGDYYRDDDLDYHQDCYSADWD